MPKQRGNNRSKWYSSSRNKPFASGKHARAICDRSGFEYPMSEMVIEPGTGYLIHWSESDGSYNLVDHPQNYPPKKLGDAIAIENPRPDRSFNSFLNLSFTGDILQLSTPYYDDIELD